jgi:excinuclease ABC subunit A
VLAGADYLIELGPEGGERGGRRVAEGPPRKLSRGSSATAAVVRKMLENA